MSRTIEPLTVPIYRLFLKYTGIFPTDCLLVSTEAKNSWTEQSDTSPEDKKCRRKLEYAISGPYALLSRLQITICVAQSVLGIYSITYSIWISKLSHQEVVSLICWFGPMFCGALFGIKTFIEGPKIFDTIMRLVALEDQITQLFGSQSHKELTSSLSRHRKEYMVLAMTGICVVCSTTAAAFRGQFDNPNYPGFITGLLLSPTDRFDCYWIKWISIAKEFLVSLLVWGNSYFYFCETVNICRSIQRCLEMISCRDTKTDRQQQTFEMHKNVKIVVRFYRKLEEIVEDYNHIYRWLVFFQLSISLFLSCMFGYAVLKYWTALPDYQFALYLTGFVFLVLLMCSVHPLLGIAYDRTVEFKQSWIQRLARSNRNSISQYYANILRLKSCYPFGFVCGIFFFFRTFTMFTCFSICSTYLVIMLQFEF